jgi:elongator complex protein 2
VRRRRTLLATGGTDRRVHLYVRPPGRGALFAPAASLEGHEAWVRGLAFCHVSGPDSPAAEEGPGGAPAGEGRELLLASVSQDRCGGGGGGGVRGHTPASAAPVASEPAHARQG